MKRVILDTSIYGRIVESRDSRFVLANKSKVVVCGSVIVRKELRRTDAEATVEYEEQTRKLRIVLLMLYDSLVGELSFGVTPTVEKLAEQYFSAYKKFDGTASYSEVIDDFTIVATASIHNLDVVYSDDKGTMLAPEAVKAYAFVNDLHNLLTPAFKSYIDFKDELKKSVGEKKWS